jgi:pyruvate formate lyase activating enzyme
MGTCRNCGESAVTVSNVLGFCPECIRNRFQDVWPKIEAVHHASRRAYQLPEAPPRAEEGIGCPLCLHGCRIPEGATGFCGLRHVDRGILKGGRPGEGKLLFYYDPLPTNCVADCVCPGGSDSGYPRFSVSPGPERGYKNLAVFYRACSFNCLYCQNYHFKERTGSSGPVTARELAEAVDERTTCVCYFGGDPSPQILHALRASSLARAAAGERVLRICWETNGAMETPFARKIAEVSLRSGGCVKFDLKAWTEEMHLALCGVTNRKTFENFSMLAAMRSRRPDPPLLIASTLLVPGYVDETEVSGIATYLAALDPEIPYRLLAFYPQFQLEDLPTTSRGHATRCAEAATSAGLKRVYVGNVHLLGSDYP